MKYTMLYLLISAVVIIAGLAAIGMWGFKYSIDFVGGTNIEYRLSRQVTEKQARALFASQKIELSELAISKTNLTAKTKPLSETKEVALRQAFKNTLKTDVTVLKSETVGPVLGRETMMKTLIASALALLGILLYMTFAFKGWDFAIAAVLAMFHDFLVLIGSYAIISHIWGAELDTMFVTAVLTTMSFSVHDTIVIFDKIREYVKTHGGGDIEQMANKALSETLVRSFNNSMTIIFMLSALVMLGGDTIRFFIAALLIGTITGTYSSPFVATPILVWLEKRKHRS